MAIYLGESVIVSFLWKHFAGRKWSERKISDCMMSQKKKCVHLLSLFFDFKDGLRKSVLLRGEKKTGENVTDKKK